MKSYEMMVEGILKVKAESVTEALFKIHKLIEEMGEDIFVEDDATEKRIKYEIGVFAESVSDATRIVLDYLKQGLNDFELVKVYKTNIVDII